MNTMNLGNIKVDVYLKDIKNIHLSVYPPTGRVRISAPLKMNLDNLRVYAISKLSWIKKQRNRFKNQERETRRDFIAKESHYFQGKRYLLRVFENGGTPNVVLKNRTNINLHIKQGTNRLKRQAIMNEWYRTELKELIPPLINKWEDIMGVKVNNWGVRIMKTKWGTCNNTAKRIWINLELAKKPLLCLEYIVVHEMVHLLERHHNERFIFYMNKFMPQWRSYKDELNSFPLSHSNWNY